MNKQQNESPETLVGICRHNESRVEDMLDIEKIDRANLILLRLLLSGLYHVQGSMLAIIDAVGVWIVMPTADDACRLFGDADDLLLAFAELTEWLAAWATAPERIPDLSPSWAISRGVDEQTVRGLASWIAKRLARPDAIEIRALDRDGRQYTLRVPPASAIPAPSTAPAIRREFKVAAVERYWLARSSTGPTMHVRVPDGVESSDVRLISIHDGQIKRKKVRMAKRIVKK